MKRTTGWIGALVCAIAILATLGYTIQKAQKKAFLKAKGVYVEAEDKGPKPEHPGEAMAYWAKKLTTPNGENPAELNWNIMQSEQRRGLVAAPGNRHFEEVGPGVFGGRVRAIAINPNDSKELLVGGVSGGVMKSTDEGATWTPTDDFMRNLSISCLNVDPDNPQTVFAGTGEGFYNADAMRGFGIFQSDDFGDTWTQLPSTAGSDFYYVNRMALIPSTDIILAVTRTGIFRSVDLGTNWSLVQAAQGSRGFVDLRIDPSNTSRLYASHYGSSAGTRYLMISNDQGLSWTQLGAAEGLPTTDIGRMEIGVGSDGVVYVSIANNSSAERGLWKSTNFGATFSQTGASGFILRQAWYDLICGVDPFDSEKVILGAVDVFRSVNGGASVAQINSTDLNDFIHVDIHNVTFDPNNEGTFYIGSDGGAYKTTDGGENFQKLNTNLNIAQYYNIDVHPTIDHVTGGTQDNGTHRYFGQDQTWLRWRGADGMFGGWDQQMPEFIYGDIQFGDLFGSSNGGLSYESVLPGNNSFPFVSPFDLDPNDGNRMIIGRLDIQYTENLRDLGSANFIQVPGTSGSISATTISPINGARAYAGNTSGTVFRSTNLGSGNTFSSVSGLPSGSTVNWIAVDPHDPTGDTVYVCFGSYQGDRVWKSIDNGDTWTSIHFDLPNMPVHCLAVDPNRPGLIFLGTELGLYMMDQTGARGAPSWLRYNYGVPLTRVVTLHFRGENTLWVATHGRGVFKVNFNPVNAEFEIFDDSECDGDGMLDQGEIVDLPITIQNLSGDPLTCDVTLTTDYPGITIHTGATSYGTLAGFQEATNTFQVELTNLGACLDQAMFDVEVATNVDTFTFEKTLTIGADPNIQTGTFTNDAESDGLFTHYPLVNTDDWQRVTTQAHSGSSSWFAADIDTFSDKNLVGPWLDVQGGNTVLSFWLYYDMEGDASQYWDGAVLELRTEGGDWVDIGANSSVPYDGNLSTNNTIHIRPAWSGDQTTWREATVDLGTAYNGDRIQFRFKVVCDTGTGVPTGGFWLDDISITNVSWPETPTCDVNICSSCFASVGDANAAILASLGNGEWPNTKSVLDYIYDLGNICP